MRIDSVQSEMHRLQGVVLFFVLSSVAAGLATPLNGNKCESVKVDELLPKLPNITPGINDTPQTGPICGEGSCCSESYETSLSIYSQSSLEKFVKESVLKVASIIETRAKKFDEIFRNMMESSKREFHDMFERTYGKIYLQNSEVFSDFFNELETYYKKGSVRLSETMDSFFGILYQKMFTVINSQYSFDDSYMQCVHNHMLELKPFGDVPHKLTQQLTRSFVATRTFYKSLMRAVEILREVPNLRLDERCLNDLTRMQLCGVCRQEMGVGPCSSYCSDTVTVCLKRHLQLSDSWDTFVSAIEKVADRLNGPYNVDAVVEPLNIKISEAIMNFQEMGVDISKKIQSKCGTSGLKRPKRNADYDSPPDDNPEMEIQQEKVKFNSGKNKKHKKVQEKPEQGPSLEKVIEDIKGKVKSTRLFWDQLRYQYCNNDDMSAALSADGSCWNGTMVGSYKIREFTPDPTETSPLVTGHIYTLSGLSDKLKKAYHGQDVEMIDDTEETFVDGSGSGSGDGDEDNAEDGDDFESDPVFPKKDEVKEPSPPPAVSSTASPPEVIRTSSANRNSMSLTRALIQYLLPMVMVWFGGAIKDLL
ncbi:glypican-4 [Euwallacea similis]|uniref:glypican-4 n=1 Tax=Euwallacea similis TaxID=1736056 RepID=UPI00344F038F